MDIVITDRHGRKRRLAAREGEIQHEPDREMSDRLIRIENRLGDLCEMDMLDGGEADVLRAAADKIRAEAVRRGREGVSVDDVNAETFEQRFAAFGTEWELEQRERMEGAW